MTTLDKDFFQYYYCDNTTALSTHYIVVWGAALVVSTLRGKPAMREATYDDALAIATLTRTDAAKVWKLVKGVRFSSLGDLAKLILSLDINLPSSEEAAPNATHAKVPGAGQPNNC